jgi:tripartite-type tricarboxylate transporter receptor subunit TctC
MGTAAAQAYPSKPIHIVVPASVGTLSDTVARLMGVHMGAALGQPIIVENLPAVSGVTGTEKVVRSPKDGYMLALASNNHVINPSVYKSIPFDSLRDIAPVSIIGSTPLVLVAHPSLAARNVRELIALAKAKPGTLNYASAGTGSVLQLAGVLLNAEGGVDIKHIPYLTFGQMLTDIMSGQVQMGFAPISAVAGHIQSGRLRAIGVSTKVRSAILPEVPTLAESGLPNYSFDGWVSLVGPAGMPKPVIERLNAEVKAALALPEVQSKLAGMGVMVVGSTPEDAAQFFKTELDKHTNLARNAGVAPQ